MTFETEKFAGLCTGTAELSTMPPVVPTKVLIHIIIVTKKIASSLLICKL